MAPKLVNKGFNGWSQLGMFCGVCGIGLVAGSIAAAATWSIMTGQSLMNMQQDIMNPKFATAVKMIQLFSTLFIFFLPAVGYAFICYRNGWLALGVRKSMHMKVAIICMLVLFASFPFIDWLAGINKWIPLPVATRTYFDDMEKSYEQQVKVIADVKTVGQYILSLFMIALLPALFEEFLFRGGLQNMLARWKNNASVYVVVLAVFVIAAKAIWLKGVNPWFFYGTLIVLVLLVLRSRNVMYKLNQITNHYLFPILLTSLLFSAVHASWYGFLPRVMLGIMLGLLFYKTNNLWYNIIVHFLNNAAVATFMFLAAKQNKPVANAEEQGYPWWAAVISVAVLVMLFRLLSKQEAEPAPEEVFENRNNPFEAPTVEIKEPENE